MSTRSGGCRSTTGAPPPASILQSIQIEGRRTRGKGSGLATPMHGVCRLASGRLLRAGMRCLNLWLQMVETVSTARVSARRDGDTIGDFERRETEGAVAPRLPNGPPLSRGHRRTPRDRGADGGDVPLPAHAGGGRRFSRRRRLLRDLWLPDLFDHRSDDPGRLLRPRSLLRESNPAPRAGTARDDARRDPGQRRAASALKLRSDGRADARHPVLRLQCLPLAYDQLLRAPGGGRSFAARLVAGRGRAVLSALSDRALDRGPATRPVVLAGDRARGGLQLRAEPRHGAGAAGGHVLSPTDAGVGATRRGVDLPDPGERTAPRGGSR